MKVYLRVLIIAFLFSIIFLIPLTAKADVAPPAQPPGSNLQPGEESTQVRMFAETVTIAILPDSGPNGLGRAKVTADFTMRNLGDEIEPMAARFPVGASDGFFNVPEITDFAVRVNGDLVPTRRIEGEDPHFYADSVPWAEFNVAFPPGEDVEIVVTYTLSATGYYPFSYFSYILSTGAGWKDTIGSADIIVQFPYEVNPMNVIVESSYIGWSESSPNAVLDGNEVRWHYDDLEPTHENNITVSIVSPSAWKEVLIEQGNVENDLNDGEAWGRLGKIYKEVTYTGKTLRIDEGGLQLYDLSVQAYEKCVELLPDDALWHAGYAELLYFNNMWELRDPNEILRASQEINLALELAPENEAILRIVDEMMWQPGFGEENSDGTYTFYWLTATPVLSTEPAVTEPTLIPTELPPEKEDALPSPESVSEPDPTPASTSVPKTSSPICGGVALPVGLIALIFIAREKTKIH